MAEHKYDIVKNDDLNESLFADVDTTVLQVSTAVPTLEVVAPATLPEDYTFEAEVEDRTFIVKVPKGGVEEGQKFVVPLPAFDALDDKMLQPRLRIPVGNWKHGIFHCLKHGVFHPMLCHAFFCPVIGNAQIMSRLKLSWRGKPGNEPEIRNTFYILLGGTLLFYILDRLLLFLQISFLGEMSSIDSSPVSSMLAVLRNVIEIIFFVYQVYIIAMTRNHIRTKYAIPEKHCRGCEDFCCALCCHTCTVSQMASHTTDYDTYAGVCCSKTGLPPHIPSIV